jgi:short-subunit dehydrogenase
LGWLQATLSVYPLVNNAGVGLVGPLEGLSLATMQSVFNTNFFGAVRLVKAVLPGMKRRRQGHIVVVSSVMGLQGKSGDTLPASRVRRLSNRF